MSGEPSSTTCATGSGRPQRSKKSGSDPLRPGDSGPGSRPPRVSRAGRTLAPMSAEDLERYETEIELQLYREYRDVLPMFQYVVETERRFYLANEVKLDAKQENGRTFFELQLRDAWVWDMYRPTRFVADVRVV